MEDSFLYSKILVVDDEKEVCAALKGFLESEQFNVETAHDGEDALVKLEEFHPQCILLDVRMPNMNGMDALKMIKFRVPDVEIIMVTAVTNIKMAEECLRNGAFGFITKPVDLDYLLREIKGALTHRRENLAKSKEEEKTQEHLQKDYEKFKSMVQILNKEVYEALKFPLELLALQDAEFGIHCRNVSWLAREICVELGLKRERMCELAGLYHDIGKLWLPPRIRNTPEEELKPLERQVFRNFPVYGQDIAHSHYRLDSLGKILRCQTERMDGSGFPEGMAGVNIPMESRILAVANFFDEALALSNIRNLEIDIVEGLKIFPLKKDVEKWFDPDVVAALQRVIEKFKYKGPKETRLEFHGLKTGMVLSRDIFSASGFLLLPKGTRLNPVRIEKIVDFHKFDPADHSIYVYSHSVPKPRAD